MRDSLSYLDLLLLLTTNCVPQASLWVTKPNTILCFIWLGIYDKSIYLDSRVDKSSLISGIVEEEMSFDVKRQKT